jgi:L,D-transpeptidase ErfK/SrfK
MHALTSSRWRRAPVVPALAAVALGLSGCSLMPHAGHNPVPEPPAEAPAEPVALAPVATHRFEFDPKHDDVVGLVQVTTASAQDTLPGIARRFNLGYEEIVRANPGVDPWLPGEGRRIVLPTQFVLPSAVREGVVINVPAMRLFYFPPRAKDAPPGQKAVVITHPIGIGKVGWATPEGATKIVRRTKDPTWTVPASVRREHLKNGDPLPATVPPGPDNPLGAHSFTLAWPSYLIHGTNKPYGVGMRSSHGCIRLYPEDIGRLFDTIPVGAKVTVVNQPFVFGRSAGGMVMQPFGVMEDDKRDWEKSHRKLLDKTVSAPIRQALKERGRAIDWSQVETLVAQPRGVAVPIDRAAPAAAGAALVPSEHVPVSLETVLLAAREVRNELPQGATWNGEVQVDADRLQELLSDREPQAAAAESRPGARGTSQ